MRFSVLQCVAMCSVCCNVLQYISVCCIVTHCDPMSQHLPEHNALSIVPSRVCVGVCVCVWVGVCVCVYIFVYVRARLFTLYLYSNPI